MLHVTDRNSDAQRKATPQAQGKMPTLPYRHSNMFSFDLWRCHKSVTATSVQVVKPSRFLPRRDFWNRRFIHNLGIPSHNSS